MTQAPSEFRVVCRRSTAYSEIFYYVVLKFGRTEYTSDRGYMSFESAKRAGYRVCPCFNPS